MQVRIRPREQLSTPFSSESAFSPDTSLQIGSVAPRVRPIEIVCSHIDYLYEHVDEVASSEQWRRELSQLKEECDAVPTR
jgi:hypothetical protein